MTQNTPDDTEKKEAASFFKKWLNINNGTSEAGNWDEVCLQWCKQKDTNREQNTDPKCKMYCFRRPTTTSNIEGEQLTEAKSSNILSGYKIVVVDGAEQCVTHIKDMSSVTENQSQPTRYEVDLGSTWAMAKGEAKQFVDEKAKSLYFYSVEQVNELKKRPEAQQLRDYAQKQADKLYTQVFQTSPPNIDTPPPPKPEHPEN